MEQNKKMKYLFIDTETTGLDPRKHSLIAIGAVLFEDTEEGDPVEIARYVGQFSAYNGDVIDLEALKVNNTAITDVYACESDPESDYNIRREMLLNFAEWLRYYIDKDTMIIGQNINFDLDFLYSALAKYNVDLSRLLSKRNSVDTRQIAKFLNDAKLINVDNFRMVTLYNALAGSNLADNSHRALADALMCSKVYFKMRELV